MFEEKFLTLGHAFRIRCPAVFLGQQRAVLHAERVREAGARGQIGIMHHHRQINFAEAAQVIQCRMNCGIKVAQVIFQAGGRACGRR